MRLAVAALLVSAAASAQVPDGVLPIDDPIQRFLQRQQTAGTLDGALLTTLPLSARDAQTLLDSLARRLDRGAVDLPRADRERLDRYRGVSPGPGADLARRLLGDGVYGDGERLFAVDGDSYALGAQPVVYATPGLARRSAREGRDDQFYAYRGTIGLRLAGHVGRVWFDTEVTENERRLPFQEWERFTSPRLGFTRAEADGETIGFYASRALVGVSTEHIEVRAGRGRAHWGFGEGSVARSDYASPEDHIEVRTRFWRVRYTNRFSRRVRPGDPTEIGRQLHPRGYTALHQLALDLGRVQIEAFEMAVFADDTLGGQREGFEAAYLNPVSALVVAEGDLGTFDNVLLGGGAAWTVAPGLRVYGQAVLDERRLDQIGRAWWGNKWGTVAGLHVVDPGWGEDRLRGVSARVEVARQRPYLNSHYSETSAYVHSNDTLGHPAGPNSSDVSAWLTVLPSARLEIGAHASHTVRGRDSDTQNFGADPTVPNTTRAADFGVETLWGVRQRETIAEAWAGYELLPQMVVGVGAQYRAIDDAETGLDRAATGFVQIRWGLPYQTIRY